MEYKIYTGTVIMINQGFMKATFRLMYCGMPNGNTFVLSPQITKGYAGFSSNIYYNINSKFIQVTNLQFDVIEVTPEYIIIGN